MKEKLMAVALSLIFLQHLQAQPPRRYKVMPGEKVTDALLHNGLYQYPQFTHAAVNFRNGSLGGGLLNYNRLIDEMQYIDAKGDTLSLADESEISSIAIGKDTFFFQKRYLQLVEDFNIKVAKKTVLLLSNRQQLGGFGETTSASVASNAVLRSAQGTKDIISNEVLTFTENTTYFISDRFSNFRQLNKKNVINLYSRQEKAVENYLQSAPVNFLQEADVLRLIAYLKTLNR